MHYRICRLTHSVTRYFILLGISSYRTRLWFHESILESLFYFHKMLVKYCHAYMWAPSALASEFFSINVSYILYARSSRIGTLKFRLKTEPFKSTHRNVELFKLNAHISLSQIRFTNFSTLSQTISAQIWCCALADRHTRNRARIAIVIFAYALYVINCRLSNRLHVDLPNVLTMEKHLLNTIAYECDINTRDESDVCLSHRYRIIDVFTTYLYLWSISLPACFVLSR